MTEYFVRNITRVCLPETYYKIFALSLFYPVQRTLCHSEELRCNDVRIPRKGTILQSPRKILLYLRGEKGAHKQKSEHYRTDNAISKVQLSGSPRDTCTRGEKAHTSKRVSIIAPIMRFQKCSVRRGAMTIPPQPRWYCLLMCLGLRNYGL